MFARTARLLLRPVWAEDGAFLAALGGHDGPPCPAAATPIDPFRRPSLLIVARAGDAAEPVGWIGVGDRDGATLLDCRIHVDRRNRGHATEAGHALIAIAAMLGIPRLDAAPTDDPAAASVLRRLGFRAFGPEACRATLRLGRPPRPAATVHRLAA